MSYFVQQDWLMGPWLILSVCGVILFRRDRTPGSTLMLIGFTVALVAGIAQFVAYYEFSRRYQTTGSLTAADLMPYRSALVFARYGGPGGPLIGAVGLLWHVLSHSASPNNRWRGP